MKELKWIGLVLITGMVTLNSCFAQNNHQMEKEKEQLFYSHTDTNKVEKTDAEWAKLLSPEVYQVAREKGTERPWSSKYEEFKGVGTYYCAVCGAPLFKSDTKFASSCGWPSFFEPVSKGALIYLRDTSFGMVRTEVECGRCHSHLGHVFDDGPKPTGLRYCINGVVLNFEGTKTSK